LAFLAVALLISGVVGGNTVRRGEPSPEICTEGSGVGFSLILCSKSAQTDILNDAPCRSWSIIQGSTRSEGHPKRLPEEKAFSPIPISNMFDTPTGFL
jgi:hypothetical protein